MNSRPSTRRSDRSSIWPPSTPLKALNPIRRSSTRMCSPEMSIEILMPALSPTMEEGKLAKWLVKEGDEVHSGDILAEIETDKATMEFEAVDEGRIGKLLVEEGAEGARVTQPIATLVQEGEKAPATAPVQAKAPPQGKLAARERVA